MKYEQAFDGEWITTPHRRRYIKCCDCGLRHRLEFRIRKGKIEFRAFRLRKVKK